LQGSPANFASGSPMIIYKPFNADNSIDGGASGSGDPGQGNLGRQCGPPDQIMG